MEQLLCKYKHGNDIHEHRKRQNEWTLFLSQTFIKLKLYNNDEFLWSVSKSELDYYS